MTDPDQIAYSATIPVPAARRARRQGLTRVVHHAWMPRVPDREIVPLFRVARSDAEISEDILGWKGGCWTPLRDTEGRPASFDDFTETLRGEPRFLDPFTSPLFWKTTLRLNLRAPMAGQVRALPQIPTDEDTERQALAHAMRISDRLALIGDVVCLNVPAPVWKVTAWHNKQKPFWEQGRGGGTAVPDWSPLPLPAELVTPLHHRQRTSDARFAPPSRQHETGFFLSWHREAELTEVFGSRLRRDGDIEVLDAGAAAAATVPDADLALSANCAVVSALHRIGDDVTWMEDRVMERWMTARRGIARNETVLYGDPEASREAFRAVADVMDAAEKSDDRMSLSAASIAIAGRICKARWEMFGPETTPAPRAEAMT